ncbi:glycosyltransferase family 4 protein [Herpetosiphon sp. NSE202]|uniref:glycosyltransferase family 4 protein n=1 Tax=Herpetosiphon sp. NSE202 TaxID=3351349 RepID=UPI003628FEA3
MSPTPAPSIDDQLRVAMLCRAVFPLHGFGGIERHVFHLVTHLSDLGVKLDLWTQTIPNAAPSSGTAYDRLCQNPLIKLHETRYDRTSPWLRPNSILGRQINYPIFTWQQASAMAKTAQQSQIDIVHSQGLCALGWGLVRQQQPDLRRIPHIANPHGMEEYKNIDWRKQIAYAPFRAQYSWSHRQADCAIATDACTADDLPHFLGVDPARVAVLPSAIDVAEALEQVDAELGHDLAQRLDLASSEVVFLTVSRLERNKGYHLLLAALAELRTVLPANWRLLMVGTGKEQPALEQQAQNLGLAQHVSLLGRLSDRELHSLYEHVDLFIHPTLYEGSSLVTLEAMIHRLPVVATAAGGIPDKVISGHNGLLVPANNQQALANALRLALDLREYWPQWGAAGAAIVRQSFDWPVVARQTLATYRELLQARSLRGGFQ